jgi:hypothetical protein
VAKKNKIISTPPYSPPHPSFNPYCLPFFYTYFRHATISIKMASMKETAAL